MIVFTNRLNLVIVIVLSYQIVPNHKTKKKCYYLSHGFTIALL